MGRLGVYCSVGVTDGWANYCHLVLIGPQLYSSVVGLAVIVVYYSDRWANYCSLQLSLTLNHV